MNINYDDYNEKLEYYCNKCCKRVIEAPLICEFKFCPYCGHEYDVTKVNKIRQKIKTICFEEGH